MQSYFCTFNQYGRYTKSNVEFFAESIDNLRRRLIAEYTGKADFVEVVSREGWKFNGILDLPINKGSSPVWTTSKGDNSYRVDPKTGKLKGRL